MTSNFKLNSEEFWKLSQQTKRVITKENSQDFHILSNEFWDLYAMVKDDPLELKPYTNKLKLKNDNNDSDASGDIAYLNEYESHQIIVSFVNSYPTSCHKNGGTLPLSRLNQYEVVNVQSSHMWRNTPYCYPRENPSFRKLYSTLPETNYDQFQTKLR